MSRAWLALLLCSLAFACGEPPRKVQIYAASSLREACEELGADWRTEHPEVELSFNFAASNFLAQQILAGQRADLFLSADVPQLEAVRAGGALLREGPRAWLSNQLVVVVPASGSAPSIARAEDLARADVRRLSLGNPQAVPAGRYAKAWLQSAGVWGQVAERVAPAVDVRAALAAVESGACDAGVVYSTDAALSPRVRVAYRVSVAEGPAIEYTLAALHGAGRPADALALLEYFSGERAAAVFARHGFVVGE